MSSIFIHVSNLYVANNHLKYHIRSTYKVPEQPVNGTCNFLKNTFKHFKNYSISLQDSSTILLSYLGFAGQQQR